MATVLGIREGEGSSPLTRGKRWYVTRVGMATGLIPAHAGKTDYRIRQAVQGRAHPRSRGENDSGETMLAERWGSSPLTRGKPMRRASWRRCTGLIPAHAGKTSVSKSCMAGTRAHPRSRGENGGHGFPFRLVGGSSPLTRGKRHAALSINLHLGLIPAHAGKTGFSSSLPSSSWAHPRSRGENDCEAVRAGADAGSSPLTRGKLHASATRRVGPGLIPAHAGKTCQPEVFCHGGRAHPRSRGENTARAI